MKENNEPISQLVLQKEHEIKEPKSNYEAKEQIAESIAHRRGQQEFRQRLIRIYEKCMISGCDAEDALEAAHIRPYSEGGTYDISNGLLLRADIHTLFDLGFIAIDTTDMSVILHPVLESTSYREYKGQRLQFVRPNREGLPDIDALDERRKVAGL